MAHQINKVVLDFSFPDKEKNTALQKTKNMFYNNALTQIDAAFDKSGRHIYIDKLEIDLGEIKEEEFAEKFSAVLNEVLTKAFSEQKDNQFTKTEPLMDDANLSIEEIIFFLERGYWHWHIQKKDEAEISILLKKFFENREQLILLFRHIQSSNTATIRRLAYLISSRKILQKKFFEVLLIAHPYLKSIELFIEKAYVKFIAGNQNLYSAFMYALLRFKKLDTFSDFKKFINELFENRFKNLSNLSSQQTVALNKINILLNKQENINQQKLTPLLEKFFSAKNKMKEDAAFKIDQDVIPFFTNEAEDKISINNAGLILLHPYLPLIFKEFSWIDDSKNFISKTTQQKAVLFLQFLINNKNKQQEHLLVLNKMLCGWPVEMPLKIKHQFSAAEKKAGEEMLDSFIEHWSVLKNTSRKGLVEGFILRNGLIQKTENNFLLQVEKSSIDILLDSLPFGIRTIKLPWNEYIIYTEWAF